MPVTNSSLADKPNEDRPNIVEDRTRRAQEEYMDVSLLRRGGLYEVHSESGGTYEIDILKEECSCPDQQNSTTPSPCKHIRRIKLELEAGQIPRPDGKLPVESQSFAERQTVDDCEIHLKAALQTKIQQREEQIAHLDAEIQALQFVNDVVEAVVTGEKVDLKQILADEYGPTSQL